MIENEMFPNKPQKRKNLIKIHNLIYNVRISFSSCSELGSSFPFWRWHASSCAKSSWEEAS